MIKKSIYIKLLLSLTICLSFIKLGHSQPDYSNSYEISLTNLALADLTLIYTKRLSNYKHLEISNSFVIHKKISYDNENNMIPLVNTQDPFSLYNLYRSRIGIRFFSDNNKYTCPMLIFNTGYFNNVKIMHYINRTGDAKDWDYLLSRTKFEIGALIKFGDIRYISLGNNSIKNSYWGFGFKVRIMEDTIFQKWEWHRPIYYNNYPIYETNIKIVPTIHFGFIIGSAN